MSRKRVLDLPKVLTHKLPDSMRMQTIKIALVGCGGNGSQMLTKLARLDRALRETVRPNGLQVLVFDPDVVAPSNVGRQCFAPSDVGLHKCVVLVNRINCFYGVDWHAIPMAFDGAMPAIGMGSFTAADFVVSCVDTAKARREMFLSWKSDPYKAPRYWLDLGNKRSDGQVVLGQPEYSIHNSINAGTMSSQEYGRGSRKVTPLQARLPTVVELFSELLDPKLKEDNEPSCSMADALSKQSLFVNDQVTDWAMQILDDLLRLGEIRYHGAFISLESGRVNPLPVPAPKPVELSREKAA